VSGQDLVFVAAGAVGLVVMRAVKYDGAGAGGGEPENRYSSRSSARRRDENAL
jgi:hypothetical protein